jgi:hypothetical protein
MQDYHGKCNVQQEEDPLHQRIGLENKQETGKGLNL